MGEQRRIYICFQAHRVESSTVLERCPAVVPWPSDNGKVCGAWLHGPFIDLEDHEDLMAEQHSKMAGEVAGLLETLSEVPALQAERDALRGSLKRLSIIANDMLRSEF